MLSLEKCREYLGKDSKLSDEQLESLRTDLYALADIAINSYFEFKKRGLIDAKGQLISAEKSLTE